MELAEYAQSSSNSVCLILGLECVQFSGITVLSDLLGIAQILVLTYKSFDV